MNKQRWISLIAVILQRGHLSGTFRTKQSGISFIELLVTLVLVSISMLGLLAVQARAIELNNQAYLRSQAIAFAYDMSERVRLNAASAVAGNYNLSKPASPSSSCSSASLSHQDKCEWLTQLDKTLPGGDGSISLSGNNLTISVFWTEDRANPGAEQFNMDMRL